MLSLIMLSGKEKILWEGEKITEEEIPKGLERYKEKIKKERKKKI